MADDLFRNESLEEVPREKSIVRIVDENWKSVRKYVYDGRPIEYLLTGVEETFSRRKTAITNGSLDSRFDWEYDLACARFNHRYNLSWLDWHRESREKLVSFWAENAADNFKYVRELSLNGFKTIVLLHGAVALGSFNLLAQKHTTISASTILAAKLGLFFAVVGIISAGLGQLVSFHALSGLFGTIQGKLATVPRWSKIRAFGKYTQKFQPLLRVATYLIYGSIFWFCLYSIILFLVLIS